MSWFDDKLSELKENAKREFDNGIKTLSGMVRAQASAPAPSPVESAPSPVVQTVAAAASSPTGKLAMLGAIGLGAFLLFRKKGK